MGVKLTNYKWGKTNQHRPNSNLGASTLWSKVQRKILSEQVKLTDRSYKIEQVYNHS